MSSLQVLLNFKSLQAALVAQSWVSAHQDSLISGGNSADKMLQRRLLRPLHIPQPLILKALIPLLLQSRVDNKMLMDNRDSKDRMVNKDNKEHMVNRDNKEARVVTMVKM